MHEVRVYDGKGKLKKVISPGEIEARAFRGWNRNGTFEPVPDEFGTCGYRKCGRSFERLHYRQQFCRPACRTSEGNIRRRENGKSVEEGMKG